MSRKICTILQRRWVLKLRCRRCHKRTTFYDVKYVPVGRGCGINGWDLDGTELCPVCAIWPDRVDRGAEGGAR